MDQKIPSYEIAFSSGKRSFHVPEGVRILKVNINSSSIGPKEIGLIDTVVKGNGVQWAYCASKQLDHELTYAEAEEFIQVIPDTDYEIEVVQCNEKCKNIRILVTLAYSQKINDMIGSVIAD